MHTYLSLCRCGVSEEKSMHTDIRKKCTNQFPYLCTGVISLHTAHCGWFRLSAGSMTAITLIRFRTIDTDSFMVERITEFLNMVIAGQVAYKHIFQSKIFKVTAARSSRLTTNFTYSPKVEATSWMFRELSTCK